jgi:asparagine synthase (glutamine-hydrolysing)
MSAIFGLFRFDGIAASPRDLERMGNVLASRGPDGRKFVADGAVGLGHCLMRVNNEDAFEAQPLRDRETELTLVADCRIDNREELAGIFGIGAAELRDMPDSAFVMRAYKKWGEDCADHLIGDFAFAVWDARARTLLLARDHMGQRGLFYHRGDGFFVFATDVKALWAVEGVPRRLSDDAIGRELLLSIDRKQGETLFETISLLPAATALRLNHDGTSTVRTYWQPHAGAAHLDRDETYYVAAYRQVIGEAVACRIRRLSRPPALCFSGGFDSGSIAALAAPVLTAQGRKMIAVSSALAEGERRPALRDSRAAVEAYRAWPSVDIRYYVRGDEGAFSDLEASFDITHIGTTTRYVRRGLYRIAAAAGARLIMDGHGGDYTVNVRAGAMLGRMLRRGKIRGFAREFFMRMRATGRPALNVMRHDVFPALLPLRAMAAMNFLRGGLVREWRRRPIAEQFARSLFERGVVDPARLRATNPVHNRWRARWLAFLDRAPTAQQAQSALAASFGLDLTRPFHDKRVVEFGLAIPEALQFKNGLERYLARTALAGVLPPLVLARHTGNDAEEPDMFRMAVTGAPAALAGARALDRGGRLSRYIDFDRLETMIAGANEGHRPDHHRLAVASFAIALAHFVAWFDRGND